MTRHQKRYPKNKCTGCRAFTFNYKRHVDFVMDPITLDELYNDILVPSSYIIIPAGVIIRPDRRPDWYACNSGCREMFPGNG